MDYASSAWSVSANGLRRQLEKIQKKFLRSIRLRKMETTDSHDTDLIQYRQHLAEVQWLPLWRRRLEGGSHIMKKELPGRSRTQSKEFVLAPGSIAPASGTLLDTTLSSFAYIAMNLLKDPLFNRCEIFPPGITVAGD
ncbi:hypothetical protein RvY_10874 [Ramazzottius varieornatus]|uniref:Uncharacterized protein n=1 Tax=Ramazzottius varieornatus TaxID=947166 RepID=A0A1D1VM06_RAMVA|nr:hypothetical protein RvY_10874 [Ramazzottius varieornatus]